MALFVRKESKGVEKMSRKDFETKYVDEITGVAKANHVDMGVACDMFISSIKNHFNLKCKIGGKWVTWESYGGVSAQLDYNEAYEDILLMSRG